MAELVQVEAKFIPNGSDTQQDQTIIRYLFSCPKQNLHNNKDKTPSYPRAHRHAHTVNEW